MKIAGQDTDKDILAKCPAGFGLEPADSEEDTPGSTVK
jgi:hypothetical protein